MITFVIAALLATSLTAGQDANHGSSSGEKTRDTKVWERSKKPMTPEERTELSRYMHQHSPDYEELASQKKRKAVAEADLDTCRNAPYPAGKRHMIMDRLTWCAMGDILYQTSRGSIRFRLTALGKASSGPAEADRNVDVWIHLDNWRTTGTPDWTQRFGLKGICHPKTDGVTCNDQGGRTAPLSEWRYLDDVNEWVTFFSPEGSLTGDKVANSTFDIEFTAQEVNRIEDVPFRCDSATYVGSARGCVFDDDEPVTYRFDSRPEWVEQTEHVWEAQNTPDRTKPSSRYKKQIPGSPKSKDPLTRRFSASDNRANRDRSTLQCRNYFGRYSDALSYPRDCDEYPYASTYEGSATGVNGIEPNDGFRHFSVKPINAEHNQLAGNDLTSHFYVSHRILDGDRFYVHLITPSGGEYNGPNKPSGAAAPVTYHQCEGNAVVEAKQAAPKAYPEDVFNKYAATTRNGWTGGDSTYSVTLPDGRRLWMFSDTFLGPLNDDGTRPTSAGLINSSFVAQVGDNLTTIKGGSDSNPKALMPPQADKHWYWLGDGLITTIGGKKKLQVVFHEWYKFGEGLWDFKIKRSLVATFDPDDLTAPEWMQPLPAEAGVQWGAAVMSADQSDDGYTYIYGVDDAPTHKGMRIARVKGTNIADPDKWQYLNSARGEWMYGETEGDNALTGVANEYSVTPFKGNYVLVSQDSTVAFSGKIRMWNGCDPYGPFGSWVGHDEVYQMPEPGPYGDCTEKEEDGKCFSYNAHVHPSLSSDSRWILSYNVNNFDSDIAPGAAHYRDPTIYRPRFVSFTLETSNVKRSEANIKYSTEQPQKTAIPCRKEQRPLAGTFSLVRGKPCP
ncbi:NucA/NucB deoxyribonuclease domain-containing protein [Streptomyces phaeoluteigriseus]|uniref:NucA/NucB deoxyribonuclease domain-containing protein n=1 Tax=Streptomyces phaeoluteigriseus TaxID=114686 RepID=UPI0036813264